MTEERGRKIEKDLLWNYQQAEINLEAFRVQFRDAANAYVGLAKLIQDEPESSAPDLIFMFGQLQKLSALAKEYRALLHKNAERKNSLAKMKAI